MTANQKPATAPFRPSDPKRWSDCPSSITSNDPMTANYQIRQRPALNQPPVFLLKPDGTEAPIPKTGRYINTGGTVFRFPASFTLPDGRVVEGQPLPFDMASRAKYFRSKYVGDGKAWRAGK